MQVIERTGRMAGLILAILIALAATAQALSTPARNGWVTDEAGILDAATASALANQLTDLQRQTGTEVVVVTLKSLQGASIETWGNVLGESWNIGSRGKDNGILLIVAPNDRKVRIAVGYGAGNLLPDSTAAAIVANYILPQFRSGSFASGIKAGVDGIAAQLERHTGTGALSVERTQAPSIWARLMPSTFTIVIVIFVVIAILCIIWMARNGGTTSYPSEPPRRRSAWDEADDSNSNYNNGGLFGTGRRRNSFWDTGSSSSSWSSSSSSSSSGSSWSGGSSSGGSSSRGSFGGGASGSW